MGQNPGEQDASTSAQVESSRQAIVQITKSHAVASSCIRLCAEHHIPQLQVRLREDMSRLRHRKKSHDRKVLEAKIRQLVTDLIKWEYVICRAQRAQQVFKDSYRAQTNAFAFDSCRYFCQQIQSTLPREIRDMVYGHVVGDQTVEVASVSANLPNRISLSRIIPTAATMSTPNYWLEREALSILYFFHPSTMGTALFQELIEAWYRNVTFISEDGSFIPDFLDTNPWQFPIRPVELVRKVVYRIRESSLRPCALVAQPRRENRQRYLLVRMGFGPKPDILIPLFKGIDLLHPLTKLQLHVLPEIDLLRDSSLSIAPVEPWNKSQACLLSLLAGLRHLHKALDKLQVRDTSIVLDTMSRCEITRDNAVWSPLGWLNKAFEWGLDDKEN